MILFGGSWGSTLALLFSIKYPNKVKGMILRGVFTATKEEREHFENGGTKELFPKVWNRFKSNVPLDQRQEPSKYYFEKILNGHNQEIQESYAYELSYYGLYLSSSEIDKSKIESKIMESDYLNRARILAHYSINNFFIPNDFIESNYAALSEIPVKIIHGLSDNITLPYFAKIIASNLKRAQLILVNGGHSSLDKNIKKELIAATDNLIEENGW